MALVRLDQKERRRNLISLNPLSQPKFASNTDGLASPALAPQESPALLSEESKDKMNKASFTRIKPKGEEELRLLLEQQLAEERRVEEDDLKQTAAEEERIKSEIDREEEMKDLMQEGGPNPRIHPDSIRYNFTTGRRPRGMTTRGDLAYQSEGDASYLKVYKGQHAIPAAAIQSQWFRQEAQSVHRNDGNSTAGASRRLLPLLPLLLQSHRLQCWAVPRSVLRFEGWMNAAFSTDEPPAEFRQLPLPRPLQPARLHCCKQRATTRTQQRSRCTMV